ncbi:uncharacterized protein LOC135206881 [Macrobrachium nipponense]|uniref:uncharacterized protein LOC135206881 n=1 Tax=Macrobrachium nipponense TaxID=159736 RepID=UPI0030C7F9AA
MDEEDVASPDGKEFRKEAKSASTLVPTIEQEVVGSSAPLPCQGEKEQVTEEFPISQEGPSWHVSGQTDFATVLRSLVLIHITLRLCAMGSYVPDAPRLTCAFPVTPLHFPLALPPNDKKVWKYCSNLMNNFFYNRFRSKQREKYAKAMENQRLKIGSGNNIGGLTAHPSKRLQAITLELTKNTEKTESLFSLLIPDIELSKEEKQLLRDEASCEMKEQSSSSETVKASSPTSSTEKDKASTPTGSTEKVQETSGQYSLGVKREKDNSLIVEELRTLRDHQNDLITQLMTELAQMEKENIHLRSQVRELQSKCEQYEGEKRRMRAMADSSCSPFVFSPLSEFSPDPPSFPDLAPLELPPLDFMDNCDKE